MTLASDVSATPPVDGQFVDRGGRRLYRISGYDRMDPFLMTLASASDLWCFLSSTGGLTAGRSDPDHALFPYETDDRLAEAAGRSGGLSLVRVRGASGPRVWEPFSGDPCGVPVQRVLLKDATSTVVTFEETQPTLGLRMEASWSAGDRFGLVRSCRLTSLSDEPVELDLLDGFINLLPPGVTADFQRRRSNLLDAYKRAECDPRSGLGLVYLSSGITDLAEPSEALSATVAWQVGLDARGHLLSSRQLAAFRDGEELCDEAEMRGERGCYLTWATLTVPPGGTVCWRTAADVDHDAARVADLAVLVRDASSAADLLEQDLERARERLTTMLAAADGRQLTADEAATAHHEANVLFNAMRGGVPADGYTVRAADVRRFVAQRSPRTAQRCRRFLDALPETTDLATLVSSARAEGDPDLERVAGEYLPLAFSRRHGDPSRPWNTFRIDVRSPSGEARLGYEGNWRDIFQNWEAMAWSYPELLESMVRIFLDATTADGYNPYRISRDGIDWEVPDPDDPWANIGYWSDHQIVYLLRLLEASARFHPGRLNAVVHRRVVTHADVPYRLAGYAQTVADPADTVVYDERRAAAIAARETDEGADARLVHGPDGDLVRVSVAEKLLLLLAAKLVNLVPDGGLWMNTQRPEWNDANNALVGRGLSVVTVAYLRRYVSHLPVLVDEDVTLSTPLAVLLREITEVLHTHAAPAADGLDPTQRREVMDALGEAGTRFRSAVYDATSTSTERVGRDDVRRLLDLAGQFLDACLRHNRREDGLYHSYNLLDRQGDQVHVRRLPEMLEGQVAVLSSGLLAPEEALDLLASLRTSRLYTEDRHSYLLYPDRRLPGFLERNTIPTEDAATVPLLQSLVEAEERSIVVRDEGGGLHFSPGLRNAKDVRRALARLVEAGGDLGESAARDGEAVVALFEVTFRHDAFTGRAGSFFAYEGLGSVYWHMVSKLLLAVGEIVDAAAGDETVGRLVEAYEDIRAGLGYRRTPEQYGAFPTDPYSHTPRGHGARQPGMTGQVKEEVLTRLAELGLRVDGGSIMVRPRLLRPGELRSAGGALAVVDVTGAGWQLEVPAGSLAFTFCQVPVRLVGSDRTAVRVHRADGSIVDCPQGVVPADLSRCVFERDGAVRLLEVEVTVQR